MSERPAKDKKKKRSSRESDALTLGAQSASGERSVLGSRANFLLMLVLFAGFVLRSIALDMKPAHFDEGINGNFVAKMWLDGFYRYDPTNFHGPLYFYILMLSEMFFGRTIVGFRFVTGLISLASVILVAKHQRFIGRGAIWAAIMLAVSTGGVFYSRYAIHESLFIFLQVLFSYGWFTWESERSRRSVVMMLIGFFGTFAVKETYFIFFGTWFIAIYATQVWAKWRGETLASFDLKAASAGEDKQEYWRAPATSTFMVAASLAGVLAVIVMYSGFFIHTRGIIDMFESVAFWVKTGTGKSGHEKSFFYWLDLLFRYELPGLLALLLSLPVFFFSRNARVKVLALVAFGTWLGYSIIPYKTPWLILNMLWPLAFVFGELVNLFRAGVLKSIGFARWGILLLPLVWSMHRMYRLNFFDYTNEREPYVYVQSTTTMKTTLDYVDTRVRRFPEDLNMHLKVLVRDPWPLPWIFGTFPNLTYGRADIPDLSGAHLVLIDGPDRDVIEAKLPGKFWRVPFQIRDSYEKGFAYLDFEKFQGIVPDGSEVFEGVVK